MSRVFLVKGFGMVVEVLAEMIKTERTDVFVSPGPDTLRSMNAGRGTLSDVGEPCCNL